MRDRPIRRVSPGPWLIVAAVALAAGPASAALEAPDLPGSVRDTLGQAVRGAEVLLLTSEGEPRRLASALSDAGGRFVLADVDPGPYRLAALKHGYFTFVGRVDTALNRSIDVVLRPAESAPDPSAVARDGAWALRLPRRSVLRELEPRPPAPAHDEPADGRPAAEPPWVRLDHMLAAGSAGPVEAELSGSETRLALDSSLGERGHVSVDGTRDAVALAGAGAGEPGLPATARERHQAVRVDLAYETGDQGELLLLAYYGRSDSRLGAAPADLDPRTRELESRSWGSAARWSRELDGAGQLDVGLAYRGTLLEGGRAVAGAVPAPDVEFTSSVFGASGSFSRQAGERHELELGLVAEMREWPFDGAGELRAEDVADWRVRLETTDEWMLTPTTSLIGGLGYQQDVGSERAGLLVPSVGAAVFSPSGWSARGVLSWHEPGNESSASLPSAAGASGGDGALGYDARFELPLSDALTLRARSRSAPVELATARLGGSTGGDVHPWFVTDGHSSLREHRLGLSRRHGPTRSWFELADGSARGGLAMLGPLDGDLPLVGGGQVSFREARCGIALLPYGTHLGIDYLLIASLPDGLPESAATREQSLELRVAQQLLGLDLAADWRLLVALRLASVEGGADRDAPDEAQIAALEALRQRVSAGLSVVF